MRSKSGSSFGSIPGGANQFGRSHPPREPNTAVGNEVRALWLGPDEWLVVGPDGTATETLEP